MRRRLPNLIVLIGLLAGCGTNARIEQSSESVSPASAPQSLMEQVEANWNVAAVAEHPELSREVVELRVSLKPDGTVTKVDVVNDRPNDPAFRELSQSCVRAVWRSSPLKLSPGKTYPAILMRFRPADVDS